MKKFLISIALAITLKAMEFALIDTFHDAPNFPCASIKADDIDEDGLSEIIFTGEDDTLYNWIFIYERYPSGGFYLADTIPIYEPPSPWMGGAFYGFAIGDFDNDGYPDIFESTYNGNNLVEYFEIVESKYSNSYPDTIVWMDSLYLNGNSPGMDVWTGDFDNDGKKEIVIYKGDATDFFIYENQGDNLYTLKFHENYQYGIPSGKGVLGDLDQDGYPEVFFPEGVGSPSYPLKVFEIVPDDYLIHTADAYVYQWNTYNLYDAVFCRDLNNNGKPELMIHGVAFIDPFTNRDDIWIIEATGDNQYELIWSDSLYTPSPNQLGCVSSAGDVTGEGIPELILSLTAGVRVIQYIPGQGYEYVWQKYYAYNTGNIATAVYDVNGNGINDIILAVQHQDYYRVTYIYEKSPSISEKYKEIFPYFDIIPSITSGRIKIFYFLKTKHLANFYIYNILGKKVYFKKLKAGRPIYLNLKEIKLGPGIYFLKFKSVGYERQQKIIYLR